MFFSAWEGGKLHVSDRNMDDRTFSVTEDLEIFTRYLILQISQILARREIK